MTKTATLLEIIKKSPERNSVALKLEAKYTGLSPTFPILNMSRRPTPPITLNEYERLFRVIHEVCSTEGGDPSTRCLFFSVAGAYVLSHHHKLKAVSPIAGMAGYNLQSGTDSAIIFGSIEDGKPVSDAEHHHCWIEAEGWIIDLCAPLFDSMAPEARQRTPILPKMFQKPVLHDARLEQLANPGAYVHAANDRLSTTLLTSFTEKPAYSDLVRICDQWYSRPPRKLTPAIRIADEDGRPKDVSLSPIRIAGIW